MNVVGTLSVLFVCLLVFFFSFCLLVFFVFVSFRFFFFCFLTNRVNVRSASSPKLKI